MEKKRIWYMLFLCMGVAIVLLACARPPRKEMAKAKGAVDIVVATDAETYAPEMVGRPTSMRNSLNISRSLAAPSS